MHCDVLLGFVKAAGDLTDDLAELIEQLSFGLPSMESTGLAGAAGHGPPLLPALAQQPETAALNVRDTTTSALVRGLLETRYSGAGEHQPQSSQVFDEPARLTTSQAC